MMIPNMSDNNVEKIPTAREICPPYKMRVSTSRPSSSVPNQCEAEGFAKSFFGSCSVEEYPVNGAAITSNVISTSKIVEKTAIRCLLNRRQINAVKPWGPADTERRESGIGMDRSVIANARVEESIEDIGKQVEEQGERSVDHHHREQDGIVAPARGIPK